MKITFYIINTGNVYSKIIQYINSTVINILIISFYNNKI